MHTTPGATHGVYFIHNGDMSGDVRIIVNESANWPWQEEIYEHHDAVDWEGTQIAPAYHELRIPFADLVAIVARVARRERVSALEDMEDHEILGIDERTAGHGAR